jgi:SAM-dependent methyltransferase
MLDDDVPFGPQNGDPTGWFEQLYIAAQRRGAEIPWDRTTPYPPLADWVRAHPAPVAGGRAVAIGIGTAADAELIAEMGYETTAFDISATSATIARERFPDSVVDYAVGDLLDLPDGWLGAFDLVVECRTVQALPRPARTHGIGQVGRLVAPGGTLLVVTYARDADSVEPELPPWPLTPGEIDAYAIGDLHRVALNTVQVDHNLVWVAELARPGAGPAMSSTTPS